MEEGGNRAAFALLYEALVSKNMKSISMFSILKKYISNGVKKFSQPEYSLDNVFLYLTELQGFHAQQKENQTHCF